MASPTREELALEHARKLREVYFLFSNPLQPLGTFEQTLQSPSAQLFIKHNLAPRHILLAGLPRVSGYDSLHRELTNAITADLNKNAKKRPAPVEPLVSVKSAKKQYPSRMIPSQKKALDGVALKTQLEVLEETTNDFLNKDLSEVDVLSVPEHYPVDAHAVSLLSELYYLTQTLPLIKLLPSSHKTLMTDNFELALLEGKIAVLHLRIEELKRQKKWLLRQPIRYFDPFLYTRRNKRLKSHHGTHLLDEAQWMATDFKEGTKFKKMCCYQLAQAVMEFWELGLEVCIKRRPIRHLQDGWEEELEQRRAREKAEQDEADRKLIEARLAEKKALELAQLEKAKMAELEKEANAVVTVDSPAVEEMKESDLGTPQVPESTIAEPDPDAMEVDETQSEKPSATEEKPGGEKPNGIAEPSAAEPSAAEPSAIVQVTGPLVEAAEEAVIEDEIERRAPGPFKTHLSLAQLNKLDRQLITDLPTYSAFDEEILSTQIQPVKMSLSTIVPVSRLLYPTDEEAYWYKIVLREHITEAEERTKLARKALFILSQRRLDYLRPPKPPLVKNIEYRMPTIWLPEDDKLLLHYAAEFCFNWELIAASLGASSATLKRHELNIERRTPWQCFERYIQLDDSFQFLDLKGLNAYKAQEWLEQAHKTQLTTKRRISPLGVGNESVQRGHRKLRWALMFEAMRKTIKKREDDEALKQRPSEYGFNKFAPAKRENGTPLPADLSKLKHDRDKALQDAYLDRQATRTRMMAAVAQKGDRAAATPQPQRRVLQVGALPMALAAMALAPRAAGALPALLGDLKRPRTPNGTPYTAEQIQQLVQLQKRRFNQQMAPTITASSMASIQKTPSTMAPQMAGRPFAPAPTVTPGMKPAAKRMATPPKRILFPPAQVSAVINLIQQKNPNMSKEQVTKLATTYLANLQQQHRLQQQPQPARASQAAQSFAMRQQGRVKEMDPQTLLKMQQEERKKMLMKPPYEGFLGYRPG